MARQVADMNARAFFDLVSVMRSAQREYLKYKRRTDLQKSKALEQKVDDEIKRVKDVLGIADKPMPPTPSLFDAKNVNQQ